MAVAEGQNHHREREEEKRGSRAREQRGGQEKRRGKRGESFSLQCHTVAKAVLLFSPTSLLDCSFHPSHEFAVVVILH